MRPVRLVIAGLNSFKEPQEIDFARLCQGNVFGIFGPTGSGKSTVVDAITLALYGAVKRASRKTQGIVNKAMTEASVLFEWQLGSSSSRQTYRVERKYLVKEDSVVCRLARLSELRGDETVVLADKASQVDQAILDILGLTEDDFTRAVVLPQGRFAEFLNLQGSERRRMLERIFGLEEYGEQLGRLVSERWKTVDTDLQATTRSQEVLGAAQRSDVEVAEQQVASGLSELAASRLFHDRAAAERDRFRQVRERQQEWDQVQLLLQQLEQQAGEIAVLTERSERQTAAERVSGAIQAMDNAARREQETARVHELHAAALAQLAEEEAVARTAAEAAGTLWQEQQGPLQKRLEQLERAIAIEQKLQALTTQLAVRREEGQSLTGLVDQQAASLDAARQALVVVAQTLERLQAESLQNRVDPAVREQLATAVALAGKLQQVSDQWQEAASEQTVRQEALLGAQGDLAKAAARLQSEQSLVAEQQAELAELLAHEPAKVAGSELQQASAYQAAAQQVGFERVALARLEQTLAETEASLHEILSQSQAGQQRLSATELAATAAIREIASLERALTTAREQSMAAILAGNLQPGQPCPVCGSCDHPQAAARAADQELLALEQTLAEARASALRRQESCSAVQADLVRWQQEADKQQSSRERCLAEIGTAADRLQALLRKLPQTWLEHQAGDLPELAQAHFQRLTEQMQHHVAWQAEVERVKEVLQSYQDQVNAGQGQIGLLQQAICGHQEEIQRLTGKQTTLLGQRSQLQAELAQQLLSLGAVDLPSARLRYQQMDQRYSQLDRQIRQEQHRRDELAQSIAQSEQSLGVLKEQQAQARTEYRLQKVACEELRTELEGLTGGAAAAMLRNSIAEKVAELRDAASATEQALSQLRQQLIAARQEHGISQEAHRLAGLGLCEAQSALQAALRKEQFVTRAEAEEALSWVDLAPSWRRQIDQYQSRLQSCQDRSQQLSAQLGGQSIREADWQALVQEAAAAAAAQEQAIAALAQAREWLRQLEERHRQWAALENERLRLIREKELLGELVSLLRGNALVEFMASEHLEAIAGIATDWLGLLSGRRYALEIAPDGGFLVRDDGNGGERRPVYTLSGGETFITSLALALALSSQVQLRGRHRLEFFFLDEGFGSLDPELLEVVMSCLERMQGQEMSIGLISHVPELKERILRQVQVTPAEPGGRGSRVRLSVG